MDSILISVLLGLIEGLTEFLPISSTGHLIVVSSIFSLKGADAKSFVVVIQLGAILAVCWSQRETIAKTTREIKNDKFESLFFKLFAAFVPTAVVGLLLHDFVKDYLFSPITVSVALILGGFLIILVEKYQKKPSIQAPEHISVSQAIKIGFLQSLAIFPGVSRSGATIIGGMSLGLSRKTATLFSFYLAIPTMFAATSFDLFNNPSLLSSNSLPSLVVGFFAAFFAALITVNGLIKFVSKHSLSIFGYYRIIFGLIILLTWKMDILAWSSL